MSGERNDEQAFPATYTVGPNDDLYPPNAGMTLRDWFAGQALAGVAGYVFKAAYENGEGSGDAADTAAFTAYSIADAMLAARAIEASK